MLITKAKCKRADSAVLARITLNKHHGLLNVDRSETRACT